MRLISAVAGLALGLCVPMTGAGGPKPITGATAAAVQSWVGSVKSHTPGRADSSVVTVATFSYETREDLNAGMELFLRVLLRKGFDTKKYDTRSNQAVRTIVAIGHEAADPDGDSFLKKAAILHSDAAAYGDRHPGSPTDVPTKAPPHRQELRIGAGMGMPIQVRRDEPVPPLLTKNRLILDQDGQVVGEVVASWNWPFARSLLDLVGTDRGGPSRDPFVAAWYHATAAYMLASGMYGDLTPHLQRAADVFPDDASILFDRACYAELLGLPMHQALLSEREIIDRKRADTGAPTWTRSNSPPSLRIPLAEKTNDEAERLFRRSLGIDPELVEARVRLARLLDLRERHQEAFAELKTALAENPTRVVAFYAHLFAGRLSQTMGLVDEASRHYQAALALFPDAQSAFLASSQLALRRSDVPGTLAPIERLSARSAVFTADPWWQYHLCAGRDADELLKALWANVPH